MRQKVWEQTRLPSILRPQISPDKLYEDTHCYTRCDGELGSSGKKAMHYYETPKTSIIKKHRGRSATAAHSAQHPDSTDSTHHLGALTQPSKLRLSPPPLLFFKVDTRAI